MLGFKISLCFCLFILTAYADEHTKTESDLRRALFEHYDKLVRPVRSVNDVISVEAELAPVGIKDVDVKDKTIKIDTWLYVRWEDQYLRWDPTEYGNLGELSLSASEVWKPDLSVYTATPDTYLLPTVHTNVVIFHNGTVLWVPPFTVKSRCIPSDSPVAEDTFQCTISLGSWTYDVTRVTVKEREQNILEGMGRDSYHDTDEKWNLESMVAHSEQKLYSCCPNAYSLLKFDLLFRKKHRAGDD
ncbi:acetylcholine receptor subunit alpha-1-A [Nephila pilipes]|uniref:Acetylcholine receptor subunit alpha-1-A n=1 Tax=Nephila pilipes TaxID=299642 RepID=A0A8X6Q8B1_NEPPI|nr:acetylcholine receptor subunit alpha-1-A [Nephila pilipes]